MFARYADFEMEVFRGGPASTPSQRDRIARLNHIVDLDQVTAVVGIERFETVIVADDDGISVAAIRFRHAYDPGKSCTDRISGHRLDVDTGMHGASPVAIRRDQFPRIGIKELFLQVVEIDRDLSGCGERIIPIGR